jgi:solute carrier family 44 (choline transporter-like protein), member 2/4/5
MVKEGRWCTDIICLLLFGFFWGGMVFVGYEAIINGEPERIMYGLDSYGNYCGTENVLKDGTTLDLRNANKLLYLNPLELLDSSNYQYAHAVCVHSCPTLNTICNTSSLPCTQNTQYVCPYYTYSDFDKNGTDELGIRQSKGPASTDWWTDLAAYSGNSCVDADFLTSVPSEIASAMNTTSSCGTYYQTTSMYPGEGPCSAVFFETTEFMHRCYPVIPAEAQGAIASVSSGAFTMIPKDQVSSVRIIPRSPVHAVMACLTQSVHLQQLELFLALMTQPAIHACPQSAGCSLTRHWTPVECSLRIL